MSQPYDKGKSGRLLAPTIVLSGVATALAHAASVVIDNGTSQATASVRGKPPPRQPTRSLPEFRRTCALNELRLSQMFTLSDGVLYDLYTGVVKGDQIPEGFGIGDGLRI